MNLRTIASKLGCALRAPGADGAEGGSAGEREIRGVAGLETAGPEEITFLANLKYAPRVRETKAGAIIVNEEFFRHFGGEAPLPCLVSANPYLDFARAVELFYQAPRPAAGIHPTAVIAADATIGENASIGAYVVVGPRARIGRNAVLHPHVVDLRRRRDRRRLPGALAGQRARILPDRQSRDSAERRGGGRRRLRFRQARRRHARQDPAVGR